MFANRAGAFARLRSDAGRGLGCDRDCSDVQLHQSYGIGDWDDSESRISRIGPLVVRGKKTEVRGQRLEVRDQRSEVRSQTFISKASMLASPKARLLTSDL